MNMHPNNYQHDFLISKEKLAEIVGSINRTDDHHPLKHIVSSLKSNIDTGIIGDHEDLYFRRKAFGSNLISLQEQSTPQMIITLRQLLLTAFRDSTIILLFCCATVSLVIGVEINGLEEAISDATLVFLTVSVAMTFGALFRFLKAKWIMKKSLNKRKKDIFVVRNGIFLKIPESEIVVGDMVCLHTGDRVPADGIYIDGNSFQKNDGSLISPQNNPSLFISAKVINGNCRMLVTSVGENTERSRLIKNHQQSDDDRQNKLPKFEFLDAVEETKSKLEKIWLSLSLLLLIVQLIRCIVWKPKQANRDLNIADPKGVKNTLEDIMDKSIALMMKERSKANSGLITVLCILILASRDGLPLAMFTSFTYASIKMKSSCRAIVPKLQSSATIGLVTTICCTAKTTDMVLQHAEMAQLWVGFSLIDSFQTQSVDSNVLDALREGIFVHTKVGDGHQDLFLFSWARSVLGFNMKFRYQVQNQERLDDNDTKLSCVVIDKDNGGADDHKVLHVHWRGAPEIIVFMCSHHYNPDGSIQTLDDSKRIAFLQIASGSHLCCLAFAYKQEARVTDNHDNSDRTHMIKPLDHGLILLGLVGLKNPYKPEVRGAIEDCRKLGVDIKLLVEDDINTARIMAFSSGLMRTEYHDNIDKDGGIIEAADFRASSEEERMNMIDDVHVMANSSPADKLLMVQCLRQKGEIVAATASCIRDSPLLREADVGIFMGADTCPEISKEDSDVILINNEFSLISGIIYLGRRVCRNLEKFIILHLTMEISTFTIIFFAAAAMNKEVLSSFQVLWINLIVEVLGALAGAITTIYTVPSDHIKRNNEPRLVYGSGPVITRTMYRSIAVQSIFQVSTILILGIKGKEIFQVNESTLKTMVYICFASCQVFSLISAIDLKENDTVVGGMFMYKNWIFVGIVVLIGGLQVVLIEVMGVVSGWGKIEVRQWCIAVGVASLCVSLSIAANRTIEKLLDSV